MKIKLSSLFVLFVLLAACGGDAAPADVDAPSGLISVPTLTPAPTATPFPVIIEEVIEDNVLEAETKLEGVPEPTNTPFAEIIPDGVTIEVPDTLATELIERFVEGTPNEDSSRPSWDVYPSYVEYTLAGYPFERNGSYNAQIRVYPIKDFVSMSLVAAERIEALQQILVTKPDLSSLADRELPFLPMSGAIQMYHAHQNYVTFANGHGVRYLTQYTLQATSINNAEVFYTFQGISDDGRSYISATFPVRADALPDESQFTDEYTTETGAEELAALSALGGDQFMPRLDELDAIIASLLANLPEREVEVTDAGQVPLSLFYPLPNGVAATGGALLVEGYTNPGGVTTVLVSLRSGVNELASDTFFSEANGHWSGELQIPYSVAGVATLTVSKDGEEIRSPVILVHDRQAEGERPGAAVDLYRVLGGDILVSGYTVFLEGRTANPIDDTMTVGVLVDNCSTFIARQSFPLVSPGGPWNANVILPRDVRGEACMVAYTGEYGVGDWREVHIPVSIVDEGDSRVQRLVVAPLFRNVYALGDTVYVYGSAVGTPTVNVRAFLPGEDDMFNTSVPVGVGGFWEVNLEVPAEDAAGFVTVDVTIPDDEDVLAVLEFEVR